MVDKSEMENKEVTKIAWKKSVWFFDIDDTLIDTAGTTELAADGVRKVFEAEFGENKAQKVKANFIAIFNLMLVGHQATDSEQVEDYKKLLTRIEALQPDKTYAPKKWSREVFIKLAAEEAGVEVSPEIVHETADAYWWDLGQKTKVFEGVKDLIAEIKKHGRPIYLITGSDARLKMQTDGTFSYDPEYSENLKRERIELLREKGIDFSLVSTGDPEDKPHIDFFQKAINLATDDMGEPIDFKNTIMVGDSYAGDLKVPLEHFGFGLGVLFNKNEGDTQISDRHQISTGNISSVSDFLY